MNKLFLDDIRLPKDAIGLVPSNMNQFYWENDWFVVKNYDEFSNYIEKNYHRYVQDHSNTSTLSFQSFCTLLMI